MFEVPALSIAFLAGLLSFLSPCVLALVPSYLAYIGGNSATAQRRRTLINSLLFVLGFSLIFIALGASASVLGGLIREQRNLLMVLGGLLVIAFGLVKLGVLKLPFYRGQRLQFKGDSSMPVGAVLLGMAFAASWTPCIGPVLGAILTMAGAAGTLEQGVSLLAVYSLGLAVPFLAAALALESFLRFSRSFRPYLPWVERTAGVMLVAVGLLMVTGFYTVLNSYLIRLTPSWLWELL